MTGSTQTLVLLLGAPLLLLNFLGGIVSAIWLVVIGEWLTLVSGILILIAAPFVLGILILPALLFGGPALSLLRRERIIPAVILLFLSQLYVYALITAWCVGMFYYFTFDASIEAFWPSLIWSYGIALGPWVYMAKKDQKEGIEESTISVFFAQAAYIVMACVMIFSTVGLMKLAGTFAIVMFAGMLFQILLSISGLTSNNTPIST